MARKPEYELGIETDTVLNVESDIVTDIAPDNDIQRAVKEEAFANEMVTVMLATTTDENAPPHIIVSVNGRVQPIARGVPTTIRRMFVEVLARCWETKFAQPMRDMSNPEAGNGVYGRSAIAYPFEVIEDANPIGRHWLNKIRCEPT